MVFFSTKHLLSKIVFRKDGTFWKSSGDLPYHSPNVVTTHASSPFVACDYGKIPLTSFIVSK
jgi:hypothetical protein